MIRYAALVIFALATVCFAAAQGNTKDVYQRDAPPDFFKKLPTVDPKEVPSRELKGIVRDANDNPLKGAIVTVTNVKTKAARSFVTKEDGRYNFDRLIKADDYEVQAKFQGRETEAKTLSTYDPREKPVLNLRFEKVAEKEKKTTAAAEKKPGN